MKINVTEITTIYIQFKTNGRRWQPSTVFHFLSSGVDLHLLILACNNHFTMLTGFQELLINLHVLPYFLMSFSC